MTKSKLTIEFDSANVKTFVDAHLVEKRAQGWVANDLIDLKAKMTAEPPPAPVTLDVPTDPNADIEKPFLVGGEYWALFYPAPYSYLQTEWAQRQNPQVGDWVRVALPWVENERGFGYAQGDVPVDALLRIKEIRPNFIGVELWHTIQAGLPDARIPVLVKVPSKFAVPFFVLMKTKLPAGVPLYRGFKSAEEFAPYRDDWFKIAPKAADDPTNLFGLDDDDDDEDTLPIYVKVGSYNVGGASIDPVRRVIPYDVMCCAVVFESTGLPAGVVIDPSELSKPQGQANDS